ncbi:MAG: hypothetical protein ACRYGP_33325 [Janthinobacterium lividum]
MRALVGAALFVVALLVYAVTGSSSVREQIGAAATAMARPIVVPAVELINVPAFVYVVSLVILTSGVAACLIYSFAVLRPRLAEFSRVRAGVGELPEPRARPGRDAWPEARHQLGDLLGSHGTFVSAWSAFLAESTRADGIPQRPFSSFVAQEPDPPSTGDDIMGSLPGYFTSVGLIFTFIGLVVALYFAAKGFRTGDLGEARAAIIQLLNAASFKFLTSVSALISALVVSLFFRYTAARAKGERTRTLQRVELYLAGWREKVGSGFGERALTPADLLGRFDTLLAGIQALSADVKRLVAHADVKDRDVAV